MNLANPREGVSSTFVCRGRCPVCGTAKLLLGISPGRASSLAEEEGTIDVPADPRLFVASFSTRLLGAGVALIWLGVAPTACKLFSEW